MAHVGQLAGQVRKHGTAKASWYAVWQDPQGRTRRKSCGAGPAGKKLAEKLKRQVESELLLGQYDDRRKHSWSQFRDEYMKNVRTRSGAENAERAKESLASFERLVKPGRVNVIDRKMMDDFVEKRLAEEWSPGRTVAASTVNLELRYLRSALRLAKEWKYLDDVPRMPFLKVPERIESYVSLVELAKLYEHAEAASRPIAAHIPTAVWWRAFLVTLYMTGWRFREVLSLRWSNIDLEAGTAFSPAEEQKGRRDSLIPLHPLIVEHLGEMRSFGEKVFPNQDADGRGVSRRQLYHQFHRIQEAAGVARRDGGFYGFHDLRRGFATENAGSMNLFELQRLMKHRSLETTKKYAMMAERLREPVGALKVPELRKKA